MIASSGLPPAPGPARSRQLKSAQHQGTTGNDGRRFEWLFSFASRVYNLTCQLPRGSAACRTDTAYSPYSLSWVGASDRCRSRDSRYFRQPRRTSARVEQRYSDRPAAAAGTKAGEWLAKFVPAAVAMPTNASTQAGNFLDQPLSRHLGPGRHPCTPNGPNMRAGSPQSVNCATCSRV